MTKKRYLNAISLFLLAGFLFLSLFSCAAEQSLAEKTPYDEERLLDYLSPVVYEGWTVSVGENETKGEAVWRAVLSGASVREYPEEQVAYYAEQIREEYRYLAKREDMSYEDLLSLRGMTEESVLAEARAMVKSDLVLLWITRDAKISLSEEEKTTHYDRYAQSYVERFGYTREYVDGHLREEVFASMLFDKTMEYLILHNLLQENA